MLLGKLVGILCLATALPQAWGQYTVVQNSGYAAAVATTAPFSSNQTSGNTNIVGTAFCPNAGCTSATCPTSSFTDNAGAHGGSGNNTYTSDQNSASAQILCVDIARAFNIQHTTSTNTVTVSVSGASFTVSFGVEVNGLGASPSFRSSGTASGSGLTSVATSGSCTSGDLAIAYWYSNAQPSAGSGWTAVGTPNDNQLWEWQTVSGTGVVTATATGTGTTPGASVACYGPTAAPTNSNQPLPLTGVASLDRRSLQR